MQLPNEWTPRKRRWPLAAASAAVVAALAGAAYLGVPQYSVHAQQRPDSVVTPYGRAPLSFAELEPPISMVDVRFAFQNAPLIRRRLTLGDLFIFLGWDQEALWERTRNYFVKQ